MSRNMGHHVEVTHQQFKSIVGMVPTFLMRDFDVVTNRYLENHAGKTQRDQDLVLLHHNNLSQYSLKS